MDIYSSKLTEMHAHNAQAWCPWIFIYAIISPVHRSINLREIMETAVHSYLTESDIEAFHRQGFVVKKGCLRLDGEVNELCRSADQIIERALAAAREDVPIPADGERCVHIDGSRVVFRRSGCGSSNSIARINGVAGMDLSLQNALRSDRMLETFFELLGVSDLEHIIAQMHPKVAGDGVCFPRHRDVEFRRSFDPEWTDVAGNGSYAVCIIPLDRMSQENGGLFIDTASYPYSSVAEAVTWVTADPGDLIFIHPYIEHGSGPNLSATCNRRTLLTGFCAFGANHKAYPGAHVNVRFTKKCTGSEKSEAVSVHEQPCPWKESVCDTDANH